MKLSNSSAEIYVPDGLDVAQALERTTHMAIAAHQDDIEIMAYDGILQCFGRDDCWFLGVVVTNGAGSPRDGLYGDYSDEDMRRVRRLEQKKAAMVGEYGAVVLLDHPSADVKNPGCAAVLSDLMSIVRTARPDVIYVHNPADKHDTHVAVTLRTIRALRELPPLDRPRALYGCEVWRALDWVNDDEKVIFDVAAHPNLAAALLGVYDSQVGGGARYDLATIGRRVANATFAESHATDATTSASYAVDMTRLLHDPEVNASVFVQECIDRFRQDVLARIDKLT